LALLVCDEVVEVAPPAVWMVRGQRGFADVDGGFDLFACGGVVAEGCQNEAEVVAHVARLAPFRPQLPATSALYGHDDLILGRAVTAGVLTAEQAELISLTRPR